MSETTKALIHGGGRDQPIPAGNGWHLRNGARSPRVYGELARVLLAGLLEDRPDLAGYPEALAAWASCEAQAALLRRWVAEVGMIDPETNEPRSSIIWLSRFESRAAKAREPLGLDPMSDAKLVKTRAAAALNVADLDGLAERGRAAVAARQPEAEPPDLAGDALARVHEQAREIETAAALEFLLS